MDTSARLNESDRHFLLRQRGISHGVVAGLESLGISSIDTLVRWGVDEVCQQLRATHGRDAWANRRHALQAAVEAAKRRDTTAAAR